jgi:predicted nucleic acid-binding protein
VIVVDLNILVALELSTDESENARAVAALDPDWRLPGLWRAEFSNVLRNFQRVKKIGGDEAVALLHRALERYADAETPTDEESTLRLAMDSGLTFYDACYLELARRLQTVLLTEDKELIRHGGGDALSMALWLSRNG